MTPKLKRTSTILLAAVMMILLVSTHAGANSMISLGLTNGRVLISIGHLTRGLVLVAVILLETIVLWRMLPTSLLIALLYSIALNIISAFLGLVVEVLVYAMTLPIASYFLLAPVILIGVLVLVIVLAIRISRYRQAPFWIPTIFIVSIILGFFPAVSYGTEGTFGRADLYLGLIIVLLSGFGITLFIEGIAITRVLQGRNVWKAVLVANVVTYVFLAGLSFYYAPRQHWFVTPGGGIYSARISRAKGTLRSIGSAQLAYQQWNNKGVYGSFQALQDVEDIARGYTLDNMIENYSMTWEVNNVSTVSIGDFPDGIISTFTVVAWPSRSARLLLSTFAITEDQIIRQYNPDNRNNRLQNPQTWDPIL